MAVKDCVCGLISGLIGGPGLSARWGSRNHWIQRGKSPPTCRRRIRFPLAETGPFRVSISIPSKLLCALPLKPMQKNSLIETGPLLVSPGSEEILSHAQPQCTSLQLQTTGSEGAKVKKLSLRSAHQGTGKGARTLAGHSDAPGRSKP